MPRWSLYFSQSEGGRGLTHSREVQKSTAATIKSEPEIYTIMYDKIAVCVEKTTGTLSPRSINSLYNFPLQFSSQIAPPLLTPTGTCSSNGRCRFPAMVLIRIRHIYPHLSILLNFCQFGRMNYGLIMVLSDKGSSQVVRNDNPLRERKFFLPCHGSDTKNPTFQIKYIII